MKVCRLLRCLSKELTIISSKDSNLISKILSPNIHSTELTSLASKTAEIVPRLNISHTITILEMFSNQGVRHEELMLNCLWKIFKSDKPLTSSNDNDEKIQIFASYTAKAFRLMFHEGFIHDPQLLAISLGRCIELASFLSFNGITEVYEGLKDFNRKYFSLAEVDLYKTEVFNNDLEEKDKNISLNNFSSQPNLIDVLCNTLESHLQLLSEKNFKISSSDMLRLLQSLSVIGVVDINTISSLSKLIKCMKISIEGALSMLTSIHEIHIRVMDVLNHDGEDKLLQKEISILVKGLTHKLMTYHHFVPSHKWKPEIILSFRQLFEKYPSLVEDSPQLWDAVRNIRVAHKHVSNIKEEKHRLGGTLFSPKYAVKVKPIMLDISEREKYIPTQFKKPSTLHMRSSGHKGRSTPQKMGFGTRRISKDYIKNKRRKFAPTVW